MLARVLAAYRDEDISLSSVAESDIVPKAKKRDKMTVST